MGALSTDLDLMRVVAATTDTCNEEIRAMLRAFISRMRGVPPAVWSGAAAGRFQEVVDRWNTESVRLHHALAGIAATVRANECALREAADSHSHRIAATGESI